MHHEVLPPRPIAFVPSVSMESATRASRRTFFTFWCRSRWPATISSPSRPTQTQLTCGLPSRFKVTRCASRPDSITSRTLCGISAIAVSSPLGFAAGPRELRASVSEDRIRSAPARAGCLNPRQAGSRGPSRSAEAMPPGHAARQSHPRDPRERCPGRRTSATVGRTRSLRSRLGPRARRSALLALLSSRL